MAVVGAAETVGRQRRTEPSGTLILVSKLLAESIIRDVPDFPKPGIMFKDITPVLLHPPAFTEVVNALRDDARSKEADIIVGIESRGFLFGVPIALSLGLPFVMARKLGKLPADKISEEYALEYGTNTVEMHCDSVQPGQRAYVVDDLLATGGTAAASARLIERLNGSVCGFGFMVELGFLGGRSILLEYPITSLIEY
ncbi:MAG: adenine phosphoribosyltransferase [Fimbriimonadaceae bacterium]|nr:adenine phosphoribosyltransferase [Fimbriimonadaceae bacterium]